MKTILIAEDNDSNFLLMTYILKDHYHVIRARNGKEAVEMVKSGRPDLVFMDLKMPIMDGLEATRQIKKTYAGIPIIALTANAFDTDREAAMSAGCDNFLSKPVSGQKCLDTIAKYLL